MKKTWVLLAVLALAHSGAHAAQLAESSFICESDQSLAIAKREQWPDLSGPGAMKTIGASIEFSKGMIRTQAIFADLASTEERIRRDARIRGSSAAQQAEALNEKQSHEQKLAAYQAMQGSCADTGPAPQTVEVMERRPISGIAKVRMTIGGSTAEVWTYGTNVAP